MIAYCHFQPLFMPILNPYHCLGQFTITVVTICQFSVTICQFSVDQKSTTSNPAWLQWSRASVIIKSSWPRHVGHRQRSALPSDPAYRTMNAVCWWAQMVVTQNVNHQPASKRHTILKFRCYENWTTCQNMYFFRVYFKTVALFHQADMNKGEINFCHVLT